MSSCTIVPGPDTLRMFVDMLQCAVSNEHFFRKHIIFSLFAKCLCGRMKCLRGPDLARRPQFGDPCTKQYI